MKIFITKPEREHNYCDSDSIDNMAYGIGVSLGASLIAIAAAFICKPKYEFPNRRILL